ncbi:MAG: hypothetical protein ACYDBW_05675 [Sulfuricaulis sp.]
MDNNNNGLDFLRVHGDRRQADRRRPDARRGVLRWDPQKKDRRLGKDRRMGPR